MNQPVLVELVFPRSGQQIFVHVPPHIAQDIEARHREHSSHSNEVSNFSAVSTNCFANERTLHAQ